MFYEVVNVQALFTSLLLAIITGLAGAIITYFRMKAHKIGGEHEGLLRLPSQIDELKDDFGKRLDGVDASICEMSKRLSELQEHDRRDNDALVTILYDRITQLCEHLVSKGYANAFEKDKLSQMHKVYIGRGGNHGEQSIFDEAMRLNTFKSKEER